ncbi:hypothetical protein KR059_009370, partial [Drosophila kikkawai]
LRNLEAFINVLNCAFGTGCLAMPRAFLDAGWLTGLIMTIVLGVFMVYTMHVAIYSMVECSRRLQIGYSTFPEAMIYSFAQGPGCFRYCAKAGGYLVDGVLAFSHYGVCVVYIVFVASSFKQICDFYWVVWDVRIFIAVVGLLLIPIFLIRSLKWLVPFNLAAMVFIYSGFLVMFYYLFSGLPSLSERDIVFGKVENIGLFFGIALFAVSSVGVVSPPDEFFKSVLTPHSQMIAIEAKMAKPETYLGWFGVLDLAIIVVLISYTLFGFFGYWRYGDELQGSISLNLPTDEIASQVSKLLIAVAIFLTYPLSGYVVIDIIMTHYWNKNDELKHAKLKETAIRISFVILSTLNAVVAPNLGPLLSLVGAFTISLLNLIFPALMEICLYYPPEFNYGRWKWKLWKDIILIIVGTVILIEGTYFAIVAMVKEYGRSEDSG